MRRTFKKKLRHGTAYQVKPWTVAIHAPDDPLVSRDTVRRFKTEAEADEFIRQQEEKTDESE